MNLFCFVRISAITVPVWKSIGVKEDKILFLLLIWANNRKAEKIKACVYVGRYSPEVRNFSPADDEGMREVHQIL